MTEEQQTAEAKAATGVTSEETPKKTKGSAAKKSGAKKAGAKKTSPKKSPATKAPKTKAPAEPKSKPGLDEKALSKGELRKLNALRKSLGDEIAEEAFTKWLAQQDSGSAAAIDPNVALIEEALAPLADKVRIPRGTAYTIQRGRGRFVVKLIGLPA